MSWQLTEAVLEGCPDVTYRQFRVLVALAHDARPPGRVAAPGLDVIADRANCRERTAYTALAGLQERGLIRVVRHASRKRPAAYELLLTPADIPAGDEVTPADIPAPVRTPADMMAGDGVTPAAIVAGVTPADIPAGDDPERLPISPRTPADMAAGHSPQRLPTAVIQSAGAPARPDDDDDSQDQKNDLARLVQAELFTATGRTIGADDAADLAARILAGRNARDPAAYVRRALRDEADPLGRWGDRPRAMRAGDRPPPASAVCGRCGGRHNRADCPARGGDAPPAPSAATPASWAAPRVNPPAGVAHNGAALAREAIAARQAERDAALAEQRGADPRDTPGDELPPF